jgi:hypothetical protein
MMRTMSFFITDLTPEARKAFEETFGKEHNYDIFPLFIFEQEMDDGSQAIPEEPEPKYITNSGPIELRYRDDLTN